MNQEKIEILTNVLIEKNMTFLLGAGASAPYFSSLGNFEEILSHEELNENGRILIKAIFFDRSVKKNIHLLNYIFNRELLESDEKEALISVLEEYKRYLHNLLEYLKVRNSRISPKRVNIVTSNYDVFIETAIDEILENNPRVFFNDGANGYNKRILNSDNFNKTLLYSGVFDNYSNEMPAINFIKCHGSINWLECRLEGKSKSNIQIVTKPQIIDDISNGIREINSKIFECIQNAEDDTFKNFIDDVDNFMELLDEDIEDSVIDDINTIANYASNELEELDRELEKMQIVFPTKKKFQSTLVEEQYFSLLRLLSYELEKEQTVLITFGFSFYDEHITEIIQRSLNNPNLLVIIFCFKDSDKEKIISNFNFDHNSIPNNVLFIQPEDFCIKTIDKDTYIESTGDEELEASNIIVDNNDVSVYSNEITMLEEGDSEIAVLDFSSLNSILESDISNKYNKRIVLLNETEEGDDGE